MNKKKINIGDGILDNPFGVIANSIGEKIIDDDREKLWIETPVKIEEFIESKKFLNQKFNPLTGRGCRPKIMDIAINVTDPKIREAILLLGKGSGKDYISSIIHLYGIYKLLCLKDPQRYLGMAPSPIYFVNTARNDTQAKKVFFTQFKLFLLECPWFRGKYQEPGLGEVKFAKNITAMSANSQAFAWLGFNTIQWVGDEIAFFLTSDNDDESESRAEECWEAALGSCRTRFPEFYKMIGITTPRYDDDFVMKKFEELTNREDGYTVQAATWDIHPKLTKESFANDFARDPRRTMRDYGATPQGVIESFWPNPEQINDYVCETCKACPIYQKRKEINNINACREYDDCKANAYKGNGEWRDWFFPPQDPEQNRFFMHFDLAKSKDKLAFALGHKIGETKVELDTYRIQQKLKVETLDGVDIEENDRYEIKPIIKIAAIGWVSIKKSDNDSRMLKNGEYSYKAVEDYIVNFLKKKGFNIELITFDQYNSIYIKQNIEDKGITTDLISLDKTDEIPVAAKYAILEGRIEYPYCLLLATEAKYLKVINGKKVDHSKKSSKDVWDAFAGTIFDCENVAIHGGAFTELEYDDDD